MNEVPSNLKSELKSWYMVISFLKDSKDSIFRNKYLSDHVYTYDIKKFRILTKQGNLSYLERKFDNVKTKL